MGREGKHRVDLYLPVEVVETIDAFAENDASMCSRAEVIARMCDVFDTMQYLGRRFIARPVDDKKFEVGADDLKTDEVFVLLVGA